MTKRRSIEIAGLGHGKNPIPMGSRVGNLVCSSGIMGADPSTGTLPEDGAEQIRLVFENLRAFLKAAGVEPDDVARVGVLLAEPKLRQDLNAEWIKMFPDAGSRPARHTTVRELPNSMVVQLEIIALAEQG